MEEQEAAPASEAPVTEGAEAPAAEAPVEEGPSLTDTIMGDTPPDAILALEEAALRHGGHKVSNEEFENLPLAAKQLIANIRSRGTKRQQSLAEKEREYASRMEQLESARIKLEQEKAGVLGLFNNPKLKEFMDTLSGADEEEQLDAFTEEGRRKLVVREAKQEAANILKEFMSQLGNVSDEYKQVAEEKLREVRKEEQRQEFRKFVHDTEDFAEYAEDTKALVQAHKLHWEDAYRLAKARRPPKVDPIAESRREARRVSRAGGPSSSGEPSLEQLVRNSGY